jgi:hypothetical protein
LANFLSGVAQEPEQGANLGNNCYKIATPSLTQGKDKSGGTRVIANIVLANETV